MSLFSDGNAPLPIRYHHLQNDRHPMTGSAGHEVVFHRQEETPLSKKKTIWERQEETSWYIGEDYGLAHHADEGVNSKRKKSKENISWVWDFPPSRQGEKRGLTHALK